MGLILSGAQVCLDMVGWTLRIHCRADRSCQPELWKPFVLGKEFSDNRSQERGIRNEGPPSRMVKRVKVSDREKRL